MEAIIFFISNALLLLFGVFLSARFAGVSITGRNAAILAGLAAGSGVIQLILLLCFGEHLVWKLYPLITHLPTGLLLWLCYHKRFPTIIAAICTTYLCCQPARWFEILLKSITGSPLAGQITHVLVLVTLSLICFFRLGNRISQLFVGNKDIWTLSMIPFVYYLYDYLVNVYHVLFPDSTRLAEEFMPFFLCIMYLIFCIVYHRESEKKAFAERKAQMVRFTTEQQAKELAFWKRSEQEIKEIRHDMRLLLNNLSVCIDKGDMETARKMIGAHSDKVEATVLHRYCENDIFNYVLSDFAARCKPLSIDFIPTVEVGQQIPDEMMLSTILSNALDNALNAQKELPDNQRYVKLMIKTVQDKLLISVKNPFKNQPIFLDGMPVSEKTGHGYGTQSIRHLTEQLGGNLQFSTEDKVFILRIVI